MSELITWVESQSLSEIIIGHRQICTLYQCHITVFRSYITIWLFLKYMFGASVYVSECELHNR